jgi:hypothetical protein
MHENELTCRPLLPQRMHGDSETKRERERERERENPQIFFVFSHFCGNARYRTGASAQGNKARTTKRDRSIDMSAYSDRQVAVDHGDRIERAYSAAYPPLPGGGTPTLQVNGATTTGPAPGRGRRVAAPRGCRIVRARLAAYRRPSSRMQLRRVVRATTWAPVGARRRPAARAPPRGGGGGGGYWLVVSRWRTGC